MKLYSGQRDYRQAAVWLTFGLLLAALLAGCGSTEPTAVPATPTEVAPNTLMLRDFIIGQTLYLKVNDTVTVDSSLPGPVSVDNDKVIARDLLRPNVYKALAAGQARMQVTYNSCTGVTGACGGPAMTGSLNIVIK